MKQGTHVLCFVGDAALAPETLAACTCRSCEELTRELVQGIVARQAEDVSEAYCALPKLALLGVQMLDGRPATQDFVRKILRERIRRGHLTILTGRFLPATLLQGLAPEEIFLADGTATRA